MSEDTHERRIPEFASLAAHQLKRPVAAAGSLLRVMLGGYTGPLTAKQQELLAKANARCDEALVTAQRVMKIGEITQTGMRPGEQTDLVSAVRRAEGRHAPEALGRDISLRVRVSRQSVVVDGQEDIWCEVLDALLSNALKYTPDGGRIRLSLDSDPTLRTARVIVADTGIGISDEDRERVFDCFYRAPPAIKSSRPGTGLGLALVKAVAEAAGGSVKAGRSELGGAELLLSVPQVRSVCEDTPGPGGGARFVVVGGVTAGPKVASKITRLQPDADVTVVERGEFLAYAGCGLPYYISGVVKEQKELMSTAAGALRDPVFFHNVKNVRVMSQTEAIEIEPQARRLCVRDVVDHAETWLDYDKLILTTGASSVVPDVPNVGLDNIFTLHGVRDAEGIKAVLADHRSRDVVIVGGGLLGVEVTEAVVRRGCRVTIVEMLPQILRAILDWEMASLVEQHLESHGVRVLTDAKVESFEGTDGRVCAAVVGGRAIPAEMVILAIGVRPNISLAETAGLRIGSTGAIGVDRHMRTSDPHIYAAGDCVETVNLLTGEPSYVPLGSIANKQGRVAAINACGGNDTFPGVLGSAVCRVFDFCVARTGLTERAAADSGFDVVSASVPGLDRSPCSPEARPVFVKLVVDRESRRVLGAQAVGPGEADKGIDVVSMAITAGMAVDALANADLCHAPGFAPLLNNAVVAANITRNKLDGRLVGVAPTDVHRMLEQGVGFCFLDVRTQEEHSRSRLPGTTLIPLPVLRHRLNELPRDRPIIAFSDASLRAYEASLILRAAGFTDVRVMDGGMVMWPYRRGQ